MSTAAPKPWTIDDFLAWERSEEGRHEWYDGFVRAMVGGTAAHNVVAGNMFVALREKLRGGPCRAFIENMKVVTASAVMYPDVVVTCAEMALDRDTVPEPVAIIEVLSPSTESFNRGRKWMACQTILSLQHYVLVAQDSPRVEVYSRRGEGWDYVVLTGSANALTLSALGIAISLSTIYEGTDLAPDVAAGA